MFLPRLLACAGALALCAAATAAPKKVLLVGQGPDGHPPQTHEYRAGVRVVEACLKRFDDLEVMVVSADGPWKEGPELIGRSDVVVLFVSEGAKWIQQDPQRYAALQGLAKRGGGLVCLHWAMGCREAQYIDGQLKLFGGCHGGPDRKFKVLETEARPAEGEHPVLRGVGPWKVQEEYYYRLKFVQPEGSVRPLILAKIDGADEPVAWAWERPDGGRSFGFSGLHFHRNWERPEVRRLVTQAVLWCAKEPIPEGGVKVDLPEDALKVRP